MHVLLKLRMLKSAGTTKCIMAAATFRVARTRATASNNTLLCNSITIVGRLGTHTRANSTAVTFSGRVTTDIERKMNHANDTTL